MGRSPKNRSHSKWFSFFLWFAKGLFKAYSKRTNFLTNDHTRLLVSFKEINKHLSKNRQTTN